MRFLVLIQVYVVIMIQDSENFKSVIYYLLYLKNFGDGNSMTGFVYISRFLFIKSKKIQNTTHTEIQFYFICIKVLFSSINIKKVSCEGKGGLVPAILTFQNSNDFCYPCNTPGCRNYPCNTPGCRDYPCHTPGCRDYPCNNPGCRDYPCNAKHC